MSRKYNEYETIRSEGGLLPIDLLRRISDPAEKLPGTLPEDYGLLKNDRLNETITQSWNRLLRHWRGFQSAASKLSDIEPGTGLTNDRWNIPVIKELGFGMLPTSPGPSIEGRTYAINRFFGATAIHLVGCNVNLDKRTAGVRGAAVANPHGMIQEFLNRSDGHLWGIVSNGLRFRVLRDNQALSRQSYLEFDFEAMFEGEIYADFVVLWLVAHATRFNPQEENKPESCWLEQWTRQAEEDGTRALGELRAGVEKALEILGQGFTSHPRNTLLREQLRSGKLPLGDFHAQLLRVIYRLIFLFVAEDRTLDGSSMLHPLDNTEAGRQARSLYTDHYSTGRMRKLASRIKGSRHGDLWHQFNLIVGALSGDKNYSAVRDKLALPALGSMLWSPDSTSNLNAPGLGSNEGTELSNLDLLEVIRNLAFIRQDNTLRQVDYKNLGAEEIGGVYEGLLSLTPQISGDGARFTFVEIAGNIRKTSGSYYTPDVLVQNLLDTALDPVVEEELKGKKGEDAEKALLSIKVCDPSVGSGHFLVGAAHRLARHLARIRANNQGDSEPSPYLYQQALRDVIGRCLYGVDVNPMAAELCRVGLWLEAIEPGKPLTFLDHHIRVGNSLIGTTPELVKEGLPDDAFKAIQGDDKRACTYLRKVNKNVRDGMGPIFEQVNAEIQANLEKAAAKLEELPDDRPEDIRAKELQFRKHESTEEYKRKKLLYDAWCAAFVIKKYFKEPGYERSVVGITQTHLNDLAAGLEINGDLEGEINSLVNQHQIFHWHLAFPEVFANGGFSCVLGNPPWERVKIQEREWFAERSPEIANARNASERKKKIDALKASDPKMHNMFLCDLRRAEGQSHFLRNSGRYPLCGRGDINLYAVFAEVMRSILAQIGRMGAVLPTGIATDDTTKLFFNDLIEKNSLVALFDFENKKIFFPDVHASYKFCLLTVGLKDYARGADFVFFAHSVEELSDKNRRFYLSAEEIRLLNPNTRTCPIFRSSKDAELTKAVYRRVPVLVREARNDQVEVNPWEVKYTTMFHMSNDSHLFKTREQLENDCYVLRGNAFYSGNDKYLPLYEAKLFHHYDHRWASYEYMYLQRYNLKDKQNPNKLNIGRYWIAEKIIDNYLSNINWHNKWLLCLRDITNTTNERTVLFGVLSKSAVGNTAPLIISNRISNKIQYLYPNLCALVLDYIARQKIGGTHLTLNYLKQLPVLNENAYGIYVKHNNNGNAKWFVTRCIELIYTAWDLEPFAKDVGWDGPPFRWDEERRFLLRCELDAAMFHLYLRADEQGDWVPARKEEDCPYDETPEQLEELMQHFPKPRDAVSYIMDTFPIVKRKDEEKYDGDYRTKRIILEIYDDMQEATRTGEPYQTRLDPPPADPSCCHPPR